MKKGEIREGIVEKTSFPAKGLVMADKIPVTVKDALPGQQIRFSITKKRNGRAEGRLLEVQKPSAAEQREAVCLHFGVCGGCVYQTLPYEEQLRLKEAQVRELLEPVAGEGLMEPILGSPRQFGYRNKMEYSFGDEVKGGRLALGLHKQASFYDIVTVNGCQIADRDFASLVSASRDYFLECGTPFYQKMRHEGYLRHLLVRKAAKTGEILAALVTSSQVPNGISREQSGSEESLLEGFRERLLGLSLEGCLTGILHIVNDSLADVIQSDRTKVLYGRDYFCEELLGLTFRISPFSFFQTNSAGAEVLYEKVREYVGAGDGKVIFDLYSGTGTIAQVLAPVAGQVVGVEIVGEAVEAARENAAVNGLTNCRFVAGDVLQVLDGLTEKPDLIVLDPPRDGIHPKALPKIIRYGVERIVYVSCKPTSLARDLEVFLGNGYRVERMCAVDMFPGTAGIETIVLLSHKSPDSVINVKVEFGKGKGKVPLDAIAERAKKYQPKPKITYKMIQEYVEKKYGFKVHTAYIAEVKRSLGLTMYDAPHMAEELKHPRKHPPKEKVEAITDALKYFEVI